MLLIIDGLGDNYLDARAARAASSRAQAPRAITSVFPSTTASAITTSYTGCTPLEHGLTGWFTYFGEAGCVAPPLPFRSRGDKMPLASSGFTPRARISRRAALRRSDARARSWSRTARSSTPTTTCAIARGAERRAYATLDELVARSRRAVKSGPERKFIYAYWPQYDAVSHRYGSRERRRPRASSRSIDAAFGALLDAPGGDRQRASIATADHGFIDVAARGARSSCPPRSPRC